MAGEYEIESSKEENPSKNKTQIGWKGTKRNSLYHNRS